MKFQFNPHPEIKDRHAFLSPSQYHWLRYDTEKLLNRFDNHMEAARGTKLHNIAKELIEEGIELPNNSKTLNLYVNQCIGYRMTPEVPLVFSDLCFGHADALDYTKLPDSDRYILRIFDLKTGVTKASFDQLKVYAAIFLLEYKGIRPLDIEYDLRIYQYDDVFVCEVDPEEIMIYMDIIKQHDETLRMRRREA